MRAAKRLIVVAAAALLAGGCEIILGIEEAELVDSPVDREDAGPVGERDGGGGGAFCETEETCDLVEQCGCGPEEACDQDFGTKYCRVVDAFGTGEDLCFVPEDCAPGYGCFLDQGGDLGQCRRYCDAGSDNTFVCEDAPRGDCVDFTDPDDLVTVSACTKGCFPEFSSGNGCPPGAEESPYNCHLGITDPSEPDVSWFTDCVPAGSGGEGADCSQNGPADCAHGLNCIPAEFLGSEDPEDVPRCRQVCVLDDEGPACQVGTCQQVDAEAFGIPPPAFDGIEYGFCAPVCGDGVCEGSETETSCPADCGTS